MSNRNALKKTIKSLEIEAEYLDDLAQKSENNPIISAEQKGTSNGMITAARILRKKFNLVEYSYR